MTNPVKLLSDAALREIEARHELAEAAFAPYQAVSDSLADIPPLCATVRALRRELNQAREDSDDLSKEMSACHAMFDQLDPDMPEGYTSIETLETRLRDHLFPSDVITDDMVNGDD